MQGNEHTTSATRTAAGREKRGVALSSVGAAIVLTGMKLVVGLLTGSLGLLAEAAHSGLDLVAALITYFAVRVSDKPADAEHPYGHGKVENVSALIETLLLLIACVWIAYEAVERLFFKEVHVDASVWAFVVILISIVVDISRSRALLRVARKHGSQALEADALHFSTDVWSSSVVLVGLALVKVGELTGQTATLQRADAVAALLVALLVVGVSVRLGRRAIDMLLDRAPTGLSAALERAVLQIPDVLTCHRLRLRQSGNQMFVDLEVGVRRGLSLESSHAVGQAAEERIRALVPGADVVVHVDPVRGTNETLVERIRVIAGNQGQTVHNILVSEEAGGAYIEMHLEADEHLDLQQAHEKADQLEAALQAALPNITRITTHIEPHQAQREPLHDVTETSAAQVERVREIVAQTPGIVECHEITLRRAGRELHLSMHCTFARGLSVREVHTISTHVEERLREAIPHLTRVTTHPEPLPEG